MAVQFAVARSTYTKAPLWALLVDETGKYDVIRPSGARHEDQVRRLERLVERARKRPTTQVEVVKLASLNMSAVALGPFQDAESFEDATAKATAQLTG